MPIGVNIARDHHYDIKIGHGLLAKQNFGKYDASKIAVVTDSNVNGFHGKKLEDLLKNQKQNFIFIEIPSGEEGKTQNEAERIIDKLADERFDRDSMLFTFDGGSGGDAGGFAASRYLRGIRYIHIPTTLLAMVDSSIGGKVGVNTKKGKNMDGAFYQPIEVISDTSLLETLPAKEWKNGLAEIVKYSIIKDLYLFDIIDKNPNPLKWNKRVLTNIIRICAEIKKSIVEDDELERKGLREVLNYGHTIGHAIEKVSDYAIPHGEAVGIGMGYEAKIASKLGLLKKDNHEKIIDFLKKTELFGSYDGNRDELLDAMEKDKKNKNGEIRVVLPIGVGSVIKENKQHSVPVDRRIIMEALGES